MNSLDKPNPLGIRAVAGVFILLGCGVLASILLLMSEHLFFKYALPRIRVGPKTSFWKSPNLMLISQVRCLNPTSSFFSSCYPRHRNYIDSLTRLKWYHLIILLKKL